VEHLIIGLSFEISVTQGKYLLNVTCLWVGNVHDMWNFWYSKEYQVNVTYPLVENEHDMQNFWYSW